MSDHLSNRELYQRVHELTFACLSNEATDDERIALDELVCSSEAARQIYVKYLAETAGLLWWASEPHVHEEASLVDQASAPRSQAPATSPVLSLLSSARTWASGFATRGNLLWLAAGVIASIVEVAVILFLIAPQRRSANPDGLDQAVATAVSPDDDDATESREHNAIKPAARIIRLADVRWSAAELAAGQSLAAGAEMQLAAGFAEVEFQNGARVVLQGPAWLTITSDGDGYLHHGKLTARVPERAVGFAVTAPTGRVIDLGTEFGIEVFASGEAFVRVFTGQVEAISATTERQADKLTLLAGQSARLIREAKLPQLAEVGDRGAEFVRWVPDSGRFPLAATGRGIEEGTIDPNWQILREADGAEPQPAHIVRGNPAWMPNDHYSSQWLSLADGETPLPVGRYLFRTTFDLTDRDPTTARIIGRGMADNVIQEIRLNGQVVTSGPVAKGFLEFEQFTVTTGFVPGKNTIELVLENDGGGDNPMGLRVEWYGLAKPIAQPTANTP